MIGTCILNIGQHFYTCLYVISLSTKAAMEQASCLNYWIMFNMDTGQYGMQQYKSVRGGTLEFQESTKIEFPFSKPLTIKKGPKQKRYFCACAGIMQLLSQITIRKKAHLLPIRCICTQSSWCVLRALTSPNIFNVTNWNQQTPILQILVLFKTDILRCFACYCNRGRSV